MQGTAAISDDESYQISKSLRFNTPDNAWLSRRTTLGDRRCWTYSTWIKPGNVNSASYTRRLLAADGQASGSTGEENRFHFNIGVDGRLACGDGAQNWFFSPALFRDCNAWYHVVMAVDTRRLAERERILVWVNGKRVTWNGGGPNGPTARAANALLGAFKSGLQMHIGVGENQKADQLLAETYLIDGQQLNPACFGKFDDKNIWQPRAFKLPTPNNGTTWSSTVTTGGASLKSSTFAPDSGKATNLFNSEGVEYGAWTDGPDNATSIVTWKPPEDIVADCSIRIGFLRIEWESGVTFTINGKNLVKDLFDQYGTSMDGTQATNVWFDAPERTITAADGITWQRCSNSKEIIVSAIEVDGVLLRDGITDVETRNNLNDGRAWSDYWSATTGTVNGSYPFTNSFDGKIASSRTSANNDSILKWIPPTTITAEKGIELFMYLKGSLQGENDFKVNNVSKWTDAHNELGDYQVGWYDIGKTIDATNGIQIGQDNSNDNTCFIYAIRVDGVVLLDGASDNSSLLKYTDTSRLGRNFLNRGLDDDTVNGGLPIFNTQADADGYDDGRTRLSTYRTDSSAGTTNGTGLVFALPGHDMNDVHHNINTGSSVKGITEVGGPLASTTQSRFYGTSIDMTDVSTNYMHTTNSSSDFTFGTGSFTIECWFRYETKDTSDPGLFQLSDVATGDDDYAGGIYFMLNTTDNRGYINVADDISGYTVNESIPKEGKVWQHLAVVGESGNKVKVYINGGCAFDKSGSYDVDTATYLTIGKYFNNANYEFGGYIQDFRVYKGVAKYTSDFKIPRRNDWDVTALQGDDVYKVSEATGAKPILVTTGDYGASTSGTVDTTDPAKASIKLALPFQDDTNDVHHTVKGSGSARTVTTVDSKYTTNAQYYGGAGDFTDTSDQFSNQVSNSDGHFDVGTGNVTIEWWAYYPSTVSSNGYIFFANSTNGDDCYAYAHSNGMVAVKFAGFTWQAWPNDGAGGHADFDNGRWNHFCIERNGTSGKWTAYMNGVAKRTTTNSVDFNPGDTMGIGNYNNSSTSYYAKCYLQDFRWYNGKKYDGKDFKVTNDFIDTINTDMCVDTPTDYLPAGGADYKGGVTRGNYARMNPMAQRKSGSNYINLSQGNLQVENNTSAYGHVYGNMAVHTSGKWYFECTVGGSVSAHVGGIGLTPSYNSSLDVTPQTKAGGYFYGDNGQHWLNGVTDSSTDWDAWVVGDVLGVKLDLDSGTKTIQFLRNNSVQGTLTINDPTLDFQPCWYDNTNDAATTATGYFNFGQYPYKYPQSGYSTWCTNNLPDLFSGDALNDPSKYVDVKLYTGSTTESSGQEQEIKGLGFQPDLVWIKSRSKASTYHYWYDALRGGTYAMHPNVTDASSAETDTLKTFDSDGFTLGDHDNVSGFNKTHVAWCWDAGGAAATASTDGNWDTSSSYSQWASPTSGFSISKWASINEDVKVGHALGVKPEMIWSKRVDGSESWRVYHKSLNDGTTPEQYYLRVDDNGTPIDEGWMNDSPVTNEYFWGHEDWYAPGTTYIAYSWASIPDFSKFGGYTGNGSENFLYLGFRPKIFIQKCWSHSADWEIFDSEREGHNEINDLLYPCYDNAEAGPGGAPISLLSNGVRWTTGNNHGNGSGRKYVYAAWAESPFKTARAR